MNQKYPKKITDFIWMKIMPVPLFVLMLFTNGLDWLEGEWDEHMDIMNDINDEE